MSKKEVNFIILLFCILLISLIINIGLITKEIIISSENCKEVKNDI